jgi:hypothetical protein
MLSLEVGTNAEHRAGSPLTLAVMAGWASISSRERNLDARERQLARRLAAVEQFLTGISDDERAAAAR